MGVRSKVEKHILDTRNRVKQWWEEKNKQIQKLEQDGTLSLLMLFGTIGGIGLISVVIAGYAIWDSVRNEKQLQTLLTELGADPSEIHYNTCSVVTEQGQEMVVDINECGIQPEVFGLTSNESISVNPSDVYIVAVQTVEDMYEPKFAIRSSEYPNTLYVIGSVTLTSPHGTVINNDEIIATAVLNARNVDYMLVYSPDGEYELHINITNPEGQRMMGGEQYRKQHIHQVVAEKAAARTFTNRQLQRPSGSRWY